MTTGIRNLTTICFAALLALGLAACGGGGPKTPDPDPALGAAQAAAKTASDAAQAAVEGVTANMAADAVSYARAEDAAKRAKDASDAAAATSDVATAQAAQKTAEDEQANAEKYAGMVRAAADQATHAAQLAAANTAADAAVTAVTGLSADSDDAAVAAAEAAIAAAKTAVMDGAMLTDAEKAGLNGKISTAEMSLGTVKTQIADRKARDAEEDKQRMAVNDAVSAAQTAVAGLSADSTDADVTAAETAIAAAQLALNGATALPASEVLAAQASINTATANLATAKMNVADRKTRETQLSAANDAVDAAEMAVAALDKMSSDADVMAAQGLIDAATAAVTAGTMLTAAQKATLNGEITAAQGSLNSTKMEIADRKTHETQYSTAMSAVVAAGTAVDGLTEMSTDAEVTAAKGKITAAETAVTAGTMLDDAQKAALNGLIAIAKVNLSNAETQIAAYRKGVADDEERARQLTAANNAVTAARTAVGNLTADSTDADVAAAQGLIDAAEKAVTDGSMLTAEQVTALNGDIGSVKTSLTAVEGQIALRKARDDAQTIVRLLGEASGATSDAKAAGKAADQALEDAEKYDGELGVIKVGGDSAMAEANAKKVLDANDAATKAAQDATAAKTRAQTAKTEATGLADSDDKTALIAALDTAIEEAEDQIEATTAIRDGDALEDAVEMVTGDDKDDLQTAADKGKEVADAINTALTTNDQHPAQVAIPSDHASSATVTDLVMGPSDAQGKTWAQIGGSGLVDKRIASGSGTKTVKAVSVAGMKAKLNESGTSGLFTNVPTTISTTDGTEINSDSPEADPTYKGIRGVLFCAGSDCKVEGTGDERKLAGSWYFTPDGDSTATYLDGTAAGTYSLEAVNAYVRYGYWLSVVSATDETTTINRYLSGPTTAQSGDVYNVVAGVGAFKDKDATYKGSALGMAVNWTTDNKGKEVAGTRASGGFEADVSLTMNFGSTPSLEGTISNFQGAGADTDWSVDLDVTALSSGVLNNADNNNIGTADGDATTTGTWTATAWGGAESDTTATTNPAARPTGVHGAFDVPFTNGTAVGVYATRKQ